jgi:hypothetical protein
MIDARSVAVQGIGFAALAIALQGFAEVAQEPPLIEIPRNGGARIAWLPRRRRTEEDETLLMVLNLI